MEQLSVPLEVWAWSAGVVAAAVLAALVAYWLLYSTARRIVARTRSLSDESLVKRTAAPAKLIFPLTALFATIPNLPLQPPLLGGLRHALSILLIIAVAWAAMRLLDVFEDAVSLRFGVGAASDFAARRISTQIHVVKRIAMVLIVIVAFGAVLMTFPQVWNVGASLFASAGIAGVVAGIAARPVLSNLLAGIQIALTEPIRLGDQVIVENEWGVVEEITSAYVVVRIWDLRRMVLPLTYFIERPFQNWTRSSTDLLGTVFLYADYSVPVDDLRQEFQRVLETSGLWDGKVSAFQVTNTTADSVELRALMSAPNSGAAFDLRCHVRERLIAFLQQRFPYSLPRVRAEIEQVATAGRAS
jgi:small-conductance mechanosensitive channel